MNKKVQEKADVVVIGASAAGCAAAILYAKRGFRVTLIEKRKASDFYKPMCTHYIQPCSKETWKALDMVSDIQDVGGIKTTIAISTKWGWIDPTDVNVDNALNIRRSTLDPLLRKKARSARNVTFIAGEKVVDLIRENGMVKGVVTESPGSARVEYPANFVVGADGRESNLAALAGANTREWENNRFSCFAYFKGVPGESRVTSRMWLLDPYIAYQFPNDGDTTMIALMPTMDRLGDFKRDREKHYRDIVRSLPDAPNIENLQSTSGYMINWKNSLLLNTGVAPGVALIGDAFVTADPLHGFGVSWAIMSAETLVNHTEKALAGNAPLSESVRTYEKAHLNEVWGHFKLMVDMARAKPMNPIQKSLFCAATRDEAMGKLVQRFLAGRVSTSKLLSPVTLLKSFWINGAYSFKRTPSYQKSIHP